MSASDARRVALTGATGFTGRLTARALLARDIEPVLVGRDRAKLDVLVRDLRHPLEVRVTDDRTPQTWADALEDARAIVATAGPFALVGEPAIAFAARHGRGYVDCTGEQSFVRLALARYQASAEASDACLLPSCGFESAMGDWAASLAYAKLGGDAPVDSVEVVYASLGFGTSAGTRESALRVVADEGVVRRDGRLVAETPGSRWRTVTIAGRDTRASNIPGVESLVTHRHVKGARDVSTHLALGRRVERVSKIALPLLRATASVSLPLVSRLGRRGGTPDDSSRTDPRFHVVAEVRRGREHARATITGTDPYGLTAEILADAAVALLDVGARRARRLAGVIAPSELLPAADAIARHHRFALSAVVD